MRALCEAGKCFTWCFEWHPKAPRMMQTQLEERRGLDRRMKDLEIRLSGALSAKYLGDEEHARRVKVRHLCGDT